MKELQWEQLTDTAGVYTQGAHRFTTDALLLAEFSRPRRGERCADLGTGCGVIPMLWLALGEPASVLALEVQAEAAQLARRSAERNGFALSVLTGDAADYRRLLPHQGLDLIACNPPYYPPERGKPALGERRLARCGETLTPELLCESAFFSLRDGGRLCFCLPAARMAEAMACCRAHKLEPKRLRLVQARRGREAYLFLLECRKGRGTGLRIEDNLILEERGQGR